MVQSKGGTVARELENLWSVGTLTGASDAQLLQRFTLDRDETGELAFRELLERHAPMVMGVCRQIVRRPHDAEDAFQATFLVLVRKARSIHVRESLAPWLYKVAYRTAQRARATESKHAATGLGGVESEGPAGDGGCALETAPVLHAEIGRLPEKYQSPIVLCHLEGKSHEEAARMLNWPIGTLSGRLSRARALLKGRLERRGLAVPMAAIARPLLNLSDPLSQTLLPSTLDTVMLSGASRAIAPGILSLTQGVLRTMLFHKIRIVSLGVLVIGSVSGVAGAIALRAAQAPARPGSNDPTGAASSEVTTKIQRSESVDPRRVLPLRNPGDPLPSPFRGKNHPNLADHTDPIPSFGLGSIVLVKSPDGRSYEAWSDDVDPDTTGGWQRLTIPEGVKATPTCTIDTLAFAYTGKTIDEIAAFSATHGRWERVKLRVPVAESLDPLLGNGFALYQAGNVLYAFSAEKGGWAILELPADATDPARTSWGEKHLLVQQGKRVYAFSLKQGKWSMPVEVELPAAKPK